MDFTKKVLTKKVLICFLSFMVSGFMHGSASNEASRKPITINLGPVIVGIGGGLGWRVGGIVYDQEFEKQFVDLKNKYKDNPELSKRLVHLEFKQATRAFIPKRAIFKCCGASISALLVVLSYELASRSGC